MSEIKFYLKHFLYVFVVVLDLIAGGLLLVLSFNNLSLWFGLPILAIVWRVSEVAGLRTKLAAYERLCENSGMQQNIDLITGPFLIIELMCHQWEFFPTADDWDKHIQFMILDYERRSREKEKHRVDIYSSCTR